MKLFLKNQTNKLIPFQNEGLIFFPLIIFHFVTHLEVHLIILIIIKNMYCRWAV